MCCILVGAAQLMQSCGVSHEMVVHLGSQRVASSMESHSTSIFCCYVHRGWLLLIVVRPKVLLCSWRAAARIPVGEVWLLLLLLLHGSRPNLTTL